MNKSQACRDSHTSSGQNEGYTPAGDGDNKYVARDDEEGDQEAGIEEPSVANAFNKQISDERSEHDNEAGREGRLDREHM
ncbi:hypothetical protein M378DRAFT_162803 [Amanita muscaria Koide BX008]|uniref:Uncharacterized protein n=1 Tax=Amanita muscaria (strain Koide BX008) TaxID=946122 RepID=A0A0C2X5X8_AMAMK|nr:hypothetical protein M378DRAFT_162803 [Amanita muscaria Koide BX008]